MKLKYIVTIMLASFIGFYACESMDDNYKQYLGEYNYSGKIDSLRVYLGYERVILAWDNPKDQKSVAIRILYGPDSTEIIYNEMVDSVSIDGLQADTGYEFIVYTMDSHGNLSVPTSVTAFPISSNFVESLTPPSLIIEVKNNEQVVSLLGLSNVMMRFSGIINYTVEGPEGFTASGEIDLTDKVITTNPTTGAIEYNTINEISLPVADLGAGVDFFPPGRYNFSYSASVWPIRGNQISIDEIMLERVTTIEVQPIIINITVLGGEVSDQYNTGGREGIAMLVDGKNDTKYLAGHNTTWMMFKTNDPAIVTRYSLTSANDAPDRDPKDWTLEASSDGQNWVTLDQRSNITFPLRYQTQTFEIADNNELYQYYRLRVTKNNGATIFQLAEWTLFGPKLK